MAKFRGARGKYTKSLNRANYKSEKEFERLLGKYGIKRYKRNLRYGYFYYDFCFHHLKILVEVDGSYHLYPEQIKRDQIKTSYARQINFTLYRVTYPFVKDEVDKVCLEIKKRVDAYELVCKTRPEKVKVTKPIKTVKPKPSKRSKVFIPKVIRRKVLISLKGGREKEIDEIRIENR
jgi:very-short-patch-repair endonuclease